MQHTRQRLYQMAAYIEELTEAIRVARSRGRTRDEIRAAITPASLKSLHRDGYAEYFVGNIRRYTMVPPGTTPETVLATAVAANTDQIYASFDRA